jgi:anthranilate synthase component 1
MIPEKDRFVELARSADDDRPTVVRVATEVGVGVDPLTAYAALTGRTTGADGAEYAFLLESAEKTASSDPDGAFRPDDGGVDRNGSTPSRPDDRHARYSFVGYDPEAVVTVDPDGTTVEALADGGAADLLRDGTGDLPGDADAVDHLRAAMPDVDRAGFPPHERQQFEGGLVGFLAYDAVYDMWLDEVGLERPESRFPDAQFVLNTRTVVVDHADDTVSLVCTPVVGPDDDSAAVYDDLLAEADRVSALLGRAAAPEVGGFRRDREVAGDRESYEAAVERAKEHVLDGDVYQGVISRKRELYGDVDPLGLYEALRSVNPSPYMYLLGHDGLSIVGASPETLVSVSGRRVVSNPLAGTCQRGSSPVEDRRLAGEMLADEKERAEHTMLVDLARNDVRRVAEPGSVRVEEFMEVLKYSHVQHIESTVTGTLAEAADADSRTAVRATESPDAFDATRAAFPAGTLSGAPKIRAMEIIDDLEAAPRGLYGGGVGYYSWGGDADLAIVIRTATVEEGAQDRVTVQAGAGIVADSDPAAEFDETEQKLDGVLAALQAIEGEAPGHQAPGQEVSR